MAKFETTLNLNSGARPPLRHDGKWLDTLVKIQANGVFTDAYMGQFLTNNFRERVIIRDRKSGHIQYAQQLLDGRYCPSIYNNSDTQILC